MHIILGALTLLGVAALWYWRIRTAAAVTQDALDLADDARAALRRFGFRKQPGVHPADAVDDPRLAAAGMMAALAAMDGAYTEAVLNQLRVECRATFRVDQREADDIAAYGRWLAGQSAQPEETLRRLTRCLQRHAPEEALRDIIPMLERIANVGGPPSEAQIQAIRRVEQAVGQR